MSAGILYAKLPDGRVLDMDSAEFIAWVDEDVAKAPPFSAEQKATLHALLAPMRVRLRERAEARLSEQESTVARPTTGPVTRPARADATW